MPREELLSRLNNLKELGIFGGQPSPFNETGPFVYNVEKLGKSERAFLIAWLKSQADEAAAIQQLKIVTENIRFDVTVAELSAILHQPGNA